MSRDLIFCDETKQFRIPEEPEAGMPYVLRLRVAKDSARHVRVLTQELSVPMHREQTLGIYDYYTCAMAGSVRPVAYVFEIEDESGLIYYGKTGPAAEREQAVCFRMLPGFHVPAWAKGAVFYQIFPDRFRNGDASNDVLSGEYIYVDGQCSQRVTDWREPLEPLDVHRFYGGDLQGVIDRLGELASLGIDALYLNPVFVSPSNHKYDSQDYEHVDPHCGRIVEDTEDLSLLPETDGVTRCYALRTSSEANLRASDELLAELIRRAHEKNMHVVLDGVFNHCGSFHRWMDKSGLYRVMKREDGSDGAFQNERSEYRSFFRFRGTDEYECWWNHETLPKLNIDDSEGLRAALFRIGERWVSPPFGADGWRLDVAADVGQTPEVNHDFWRAFRSHVRSANPDAFVFAEHYGDPSEWLCGDEWDSIMNYDAFMEPVSWFLTGMEKHGDAYDASLHGDGRAFFAMMRQAMSRLPVQALHSALNQLDNHDHSRFITRTNGQVGRLAALGAQAASAGISLALYRIAVVMQMTWPGNPGLYYGNETALCGFTDPDNRRPYPWGEENYELIDFYRYAIGLRKKSRLFAEGSLIELAAERDLIAYGRFTDEEAAVIVVNSGRQERTADIDLRLLLGTAPRRVTRMLLTDENGCNVGQKPVNAMGGLLSVSLEPVSAAVFLLNDFTL